MQLRQPRVGDIVDDYCPRERRLSDHAVVAMVGDHVRQTRCTTCDTEHEYKQGKLPPGRKKTTPALPPKPPAGVTATAAVSPRPPEPAALPGDAQPEPGAAGAPGPDPSGGTPGPVPEGAPGHEGSVHRRLIRAVLPRIVGEIPVRQAPEFTMHTAGQRPAARGGKVQRGVHGGGQPRHVAKTGHDRQPGSRSSGGGPFGQRGHGGHAGPQAHGGPRHGRPQGSGQGQRKKH